MKFEIPKYVPVVKGAKFCPNPVARYGIPDIANSGANRDVEGTIAWEEYWSEQLNYCINGYTTGGVFIPGRYYYYLNFCLIHTILRGAHYPEYVDIDLEFFNIIEQAKKEYKGLIIPKGRRKGVSEKMAKGVLDYGMTFTPSGYRGGICAGVSGYADSLFRKVKINNAEKPRELQLHYLYDNADMLQSGWEEKTSSGTVAKGSFNLILCRSMKLDPNLFKGEYFNDVIFEEAGEFNKVRETFDATEAGLKIGERMVGCPVVLGTGGKQSKSGEFQEMFNEAESLNLIRFVVPGYRMYVGCFAGGRDEKGDIYEDIPNLVAKYTPEERIGMEDTQRALDKIESRAAELLAARNKQKYFEHLIDYPRNVSDIFVSFSGNNFDPEILSMQRSRLDSSVNAQFGRYTLDFDRHDDGSVRLPMTVKATPAHENTPDDMVVFIRNHPVPNYKDLETAGIDSYDQDETKTSKSLGAMVVLRRANNPTVPGKKFPVALINCRPKRKELFYEMCFKLAVYYNLKGNVLGDARNPLIMEYFKRHGGEKYLALRPTSFESANSEQQNKYWFNITVHSKPRMIAVMQTWVLDNADECWFPQIIDELLSYNVEQKNSDWDCADALGIALVRDIDMTRSPQMETVSGGVDPFALPEWRTNADGVMVNIARKVSDSEQAKDPFLRMIQEGRL